MEDYNNKLLEAVVIGLMAMATIIACVGLYYNVNYYVGDYKYDLNKDGYVNNKDLQLIEAHLNGNIELSGDMLIKADLNKDGEITLLDLAIMKSELLERGITNESN